MLTPTRNLAIVSIAVITIAAGLVVIAGWLLNMPALQSIVPGFIAMKFNAALCFVLFGLALLLTQFGHFKLCRALFFVTSLSGTLIGLLTLLQDIFHYNTGIDLFFVGDHTPISKMFPYPGRMAFNSSINFVLL